MMVGGKPAKKLRKIIVARPGKNLVWRLVASQNPITISSSVFAPIEFAFFFLSFLIFLKKASIIFVNDSWPNSEVEGADVDLPDALSSLTICFVGKEGVEPFVQHKNVF